MEIIKTATDKTESELVKENSDVEEESAGNSVKTKLHKFVNNIRVEPALFLFALARQFYEVQVG